MSVLNYYILIQHPGCFMELLRMCHPAMHYSVGAPHVFRGEKSILLFSTCLSFWNVLFRDAQGRGKVTFGSEKFPIFFSQWHQNTLAYGCRNSLSLRTPLDSYLIQLQDVFFCGLLCLSLTSFLLHLFVRC